MVFEINIIDVAPEQADAFAAAFAEALPDILSVRGCRAAELRRCVEAPARFMVHIEWERIEDHRDHYPTTEAAARIRALLRPLIASAQPAHYERVELAALRR